MKATLAVIACIHNPIPKSDIGDDMWDFGNDIKLSLDCGQLHMHIWDMGDI